MVTVPTSVVGSSVPVIPCVSSSREDSANAALTGRIWANRTAPSGAAATVTPAFACHSGAVVARTPTRPTVLGASAAPSSGVVASGAAAPSAGASSAGSVVSAEQAAISSAAVSSAARRDVGRRRGGRCVEDARAPLPMTSPPRRRRAPGEHRQGSPAPSLPAARTSGVFIAPTACRLPQDPPGPAERPEGPARVGCDRRAEGTGHPPEDLRADRPRRHLARWRPVSPGPHPAALHAPQPAAERCADGAPGASRRGTASSTPQKPSHRIVEAVGSPSPQSRRAPRNPQDVAAARLAESPSPQSRRAPRNVSSATIVSSSSPSPQSRRAPRNRPLPRQ